MLTVNNAVRFLVAGTVAAAMFVMTGSEALARPKYLNVANGLYPDLAKKHGTDGKLTCALCHPEKDKKIRNNYGAAVGGKLEKKNETDEAKIKDALTRHCRSGKVSIAAIIEPKERDFQSKISLLFVILPGKTPRRGKTELKTVAEPINLLVSQVMCVSQPA